jgi:Putative prokaryotic signal transducing protein
LASMLKIATSTGNEPEAQLACSRLAAEGIHSMLQPSGVGGARGWGAVGACDVYVEEADLQRAREVLKTEPVSEEELIREEELAASTGPPDPDVGDPAQTAAPEKHHLFRGFGKDHSA